MQVCSWKLFNMKELLNTLLHFIEHPNEIRKSFDEFIDHLMPGKFLDLKI